MNKTKFPGRYLHLKCAAVIFVFLLFFFSAAWPRTGSTPANNKKQVIILKSDDFVVSDQWERFIKYIEVKEIKACLGVVGKELYNEPLCEWITLLSTKNNFEFWNHGLTHDCGEGYSEFKDTPYEEQLMHLQKAQSLFKDKFGITLRAFNAPCMEFDENTSRALADIEDIKIWFYGKTGSSKLCLERKGNIEFPTGHPDYSRFIERYNQDRLEQYDHLALQLHPGWWDDRRWQEFEKIIDFLLEKEAVFMTASEYYQSITAVITVTNTGNSGPGSLRDAVDQANNNTLENAEIVLPPGIYYLSGTTGDNDNSGGDLDIASDLAILGAGADSTIIDGGGNDRVFHIHSGKVNISGVAVRHGRANSGGGIRVDGGTVTIGNCIISENTAAGGGNPGEHGGGGIYVQHAGVTISGCTISHNSGNSTAGMKGGGIYINQSNTNKRADIRNCLIEGNTANTHTPGTGWGGGVYLWAGNAGLEKNRFIENTASVNGDGPGGAIFAGGGTALILTNNLLVNNRAGSLGDSYGDGIYLSGRAGPGQNKTVVCTMVHNTLADNNGENNGNGGGAIHVGDYVTADLANNLITGHRKGIYNNDATGNSTIAADTNLFFNTGDPVVGTNALRQDPLLTSEFKPTADSPVVDAGKTIGTVTTDLEGNLRPRGNGWDIGCYEYSADPRPLIAVDRTLFSFAGSGSDVTAGQLLRISNGGTGTLNWTAEPGESWIQVRPAAGRGAGTVTITVDPAGLVPGSYSGAISVGDAAAPDSPQIVNVNLTVYKPGLTGSPFGFFVSPQDGAAGVSGAIPVSGWALDDIQVETVEIYREQAGKLIFVDNAIFVEGARPDVEQAYPDYPFNYKAGWGYMMLTYFLPNRGTGTFTFYAVAADKEGNRVTLGSKTITCDNANAVKPFGTIDTPAQGGSTSGKRFANWGWVLTPRPNHIPPDGSTINVWVDGVNLGHPAYNMYRADIAGLFPGYFNGDGAAGYFYLDTTVYRNGVHTISWTVEDSAGNKDGIGSRYFLVRNIGGLYDPLRTANTVNCTPQKITLKREDLYALPVDHHTPLAVKRGYGENIKPCRIYPGDNGISYIKTRELERVEIRFFCEGSEISGYMPAGNQRGPLPVGSTLDTQTGTFCWQPGPGFVGVYRLNFIVKGRNGEMSRSDIIIEIQCDILQAK